MNPKETGVTAAIAELMGDHEVILRMIAALGGLCRRLDGGGAEVSADLDAAVDFIAVYADHCHHAKEEDLLFPAMERAGFPRDGGPVGVMLTEHRQGRELVAAMRAAAAALKSASVPAARDFARAASAYGELLSQHIMKENRILYPMAMQAVPEKEWTRISAEFARVESERMGPAKRAAYEALVARLESAYGAATPPRRAWRTR